MNPQAFTIASNASLGDSVSALKRIHEPELNIAVQQRSIDHLAKDLQILVKNDASIKIMGNAGQVLEVVQKHFEHYDLSESPVISDIENLLGVFQEVTGSIEIRFLLDTVRNNMCKRFHTDINDLRLLCTYWGAGTLWIEESGDERDEILVREPGTAPNTNPECIRQAKAGDILILKGALYPNGQPVIHRSPPIEADNGVRLLLRMDTNENLFI